MDILELEGRKISGGRARAKALACLESISFYGGVDPETGVVKERGHPLEGLSISGRILVFPQGRGSTVGSYTLYRLSRNGQAPAAIINRECETIVAVGAIISDIPCVDKIDIELIKSGQEVEVDGEDGVVRFISG